MIKARCTCTYCGHEWITYFPSAAAMEAAACPKCKDTSLKIAEYKPTGDIFGYYK